MSTHKQFGMTKKEPSGTAVGNGADLTRHIGYDLLGPIVHRWLLGLHQYISYFDDRATVFLYCARAGLRIQQLYRLFLRTTKLEAPKGLQEMFWISRLSVCKGVYARMPERVAQVIAQEYYHQPISELIMGLFRYQQDYLAKCILQRNEHKAFGFNFSGWLKGKTPESRLLKAYLHECSKAFDYYIRQLTTEKKRAVLIDSGWKGSAQSLLKNAFPEVEWKGLYFGRILKGQHDLAVADGIIGILFESDQYDIAVPESAFVEHRHIIETLLEPNGPSIEEIPAPPFMNVTQELIDANMADTPDPEKDILYLYVLDYLKDHGEESGFTEIFACHEAAMKELARIILTPTREEVRALYCKDRSADFGKELKVPVVLDPENGDHTESDQRIQQALWRQGQVALEYVGGAAYELQMRLTGESNVVSFFDSKVAVRTCNTSAPSAELPALPSVAVITRTKNRQLLLKRAAESGAAQTYPNYYWIVVNDGGDEEAVRAVIEQCTIDRRRIQLVSNKTSLGMEAASNVGIRTCLSDYIVIHDDDDSWAPEFLEKTLTFLESPAGKRYEGVITHSVYISEEIRGQSIIEHDRYPYHSWVKNIQLSEMAVSNFFPPIAFVFRRRIWEEIGGYNEGLPVLGDWYFNLEFLLRANIGVIPEALAFYHHRDKGDSRSGLYANSVIGAVSKHEEFTAIVRNEFLRKNLGRFPAAAVILQGYTISDYRYRFSTLLGNRSANGSGNKTPLVNAEKYRVAAQVNRALANTNPVLRVLQRTWCGVDPDAPLDNILAVMQKIKLRVTPPPDFDEEGYLACNPDVDAVVRAGKIPSGYYHYLKHGYKEGRVRPTRQR